MGKKNTLSKRVASLEKKQKKQKQEIHEICTNQAATGVPLAGTLIELSNVPTANRAGDNIYARKYVVNFNFSTNKSTLYDRVLTRFMVVRSKAGTITAAAMPASPTACPNLDLYYVLEDKLFEQSAQCWDGTNYAAFKSRTIKFIKKYKNGMKVQYDGAASSTGAGVYLWMISDENNATVYEGYNLVLYADN